MTTRAEDRAYCLMGIFDVNMPLLYGEGGQRAFERLQAEIFNATNDQSILLHKRHLALDCGVLAKSPNDFGTRHMFEKGHGLPHTLLQRLHNGIEASLLLHPTFGKKNVYWGIIECLYVDDPLKLDRHAWTLLWRGEGYPYYRIK
ncbi:hypothetical protein GGR57DRAFT_186006 [Xylariaceae sp. FL1272]|nr:hypothetical protein GGR57DRAFT_186006 [Xylariaceae sp. FL1272]